MPLFWGHVCWHRHHKRETAQLIESWKYEEIDPLLLLITHCAIAYGEELSGIGILEKVDANYIADNRKVISTMIVKGSRGMRTMQAQSWVQGMDKAFSEFLSPPRDEGTKMLKLGDELWIYTPTTDRTIKIAGHMLRRSLMGSDISYEDYMEDPKLSNLYDVELVGEEISAIETVMFLNSLPKKEVVVPFSEIVGR